MDTNSRPRWRLVFKETWSKPGWWCQLNFAQVLEVLVWAGQVLLKDQSRKHQPTDGTSFKEALGTVVHELLLWICLTLKKKTKEWKLKQTHNRSSMDSWKHLGLSMDYSQTRSSLNRREIRRQGCRRMPQSKGETFGDLGNGVRKSKKMMANRQKSRPNRDQIETSFLILFLPFSTSSHAIPSFAQSVPSTNIVRHCRCFCWGPLA